MQLGSYCLTGYIPAFSCCCYTMTNGGPVLWCTKQPSSFWFFCTRKKDGSFPCEKPPWNSMEDQDINFHGIPWKFLHRFPWKIFAQRIRTFPNGIPSKTLGHQFPLNSMEISASTFSMGDQDIFYGIPWKSSIQFHRNYSMDYSMDLQGVSWNSQELDI